MLSAQELACDECHEVHQHLSNFGTGSLTLRIKDHTVSAVHDAHLVGPCHGDLSVGADRVGILEVAHRVVAHGSADIAPQHGGTARTIYSRWFFFSFTGVPPDQYLAWLIRRGTCPFTRIIAELRFESNSVFSFGNRHIYCPTIAACRADWHKSRYSRLPGTLLSYGRSHANTQLFSVKKQQKSLEALVSRL